MTDDITEAGRMALALINETMAGIPDDAKAELTKLRADMDGYAAQLREAGWTQGQTGALIMDGLVTKGYSQQLRILVAMECLK